MDALKLSVSLDKARSHKKHQTGDIGIRSVTEQTMLH